MNKASPHSFTTLPPPDVEKIRLMPLSETNMQTLGYWHGMAGVAIPHSAHMLNPAYLDAYFMGCERRPVR